MKTLARRYLAVVALLWGVACGCGMPASPDQHSLSAAAAQQTLDQWNPTYCKVVEFYGFHRPGPGDTRVAYVLITNPGEQPQKQAIYEARFQLLTRPDGREQWFLTSLLNHAAGLSRRQGWDNLFIPVQAEASAAKAPAAKAK
jgi:hypothetical protein